MYFQHDIESFSEQYADLKWLESKVEGRRINENSGKDKRHRFREVTA